MLVLVLSDIHNNIDHFRLVREQEDNVYDAVIVAGDIGSEIAGEFFSLLDTFECPSFCVYGNWDHNLDYKASLSENCLLLHHNIERIGSYYVTGYSGCTAAWGKNPFYREEREILLEKHSAILSLVEAEKSKISSQKAQIDLEFKDALSNLMASAEDRRRKKYRQDLARLERRKEKSIKKAEKYLKTLLGSQEYEGYVDDKVSMSKIVLNRNRTVLFDTIKRSEVPHDRLIIVTHERLYRVAEEGVRPMLHIFGHVHEFTFNSFKGTLYLNAAAIDNGFSAAFGRKKLCPEGYCSVTIEHGKVSLVRRRLLKNEKELVAGITGDA